MKCPIHGTEFDPVKGEGCPQCLEEKKGGRVEIIHNAITVTEPITQDGESIDIHLEVEPATTVKETTLTTPDKDEAIKVLIEEAKSMVKYANELIITNSDDVKNATADLALVAGLTKQLKAKRDEYVKPLQAEADKAKAFFNNIMNPVAEAYIIGKGKILTYNAEVDRKIAEAKRIEDEKYRLAQEEARLNGGEITIDLTPIEKPAETPQIVRTDIGNASKMTVRKWEVEDITKVPVEYLKVDGVAIGKLVRAGIKSMAGIRIWEEKTLRVNVHYNSIASGKD